MSSVYGLKSFCIASSRDLFHAALAHPVDADIGFQKKIQLLSQDLYLDRRWLVAEVETQCHIVSFLNKI